MKKQLNIRATGNKGFFLPYTIFISMLIILQLTTMIVLYENKVTTSKTMNELVETKTLIQMSRAKFINEKVYEESKDGEINYKHPNGDVKLHFEWLDETIVEATMLMETKQGTKIQRGFNLYFSDRDTGEERTVEE